MTTTPTSDELAYLRLYESSTYSIQIPRSLAKGMEEKGWVSWVPATFGNGIAWRITDAGRAVRYPGVPQATEE